MAEEPKHAGSRLLVVDDETAVLKLVKTMLVRGNHEVTTAGSAAEALKILQGKTFDCVITDAIMPTLNGYDLVRAIRSNPDLAEMPVLMLTRKRHRLDVKRAVDAGVTDYVLKPIDEHLLLEKVSLCIDKGKGKRHIVELSVSPGHIQGTLSFNCSITSMSETDVTIRIPIPLPMGGYSFQLPVFGEIGIGMPLLKLMSCEPTAIERGSDSIEMEYDAKFAFVGVVETDLKKIRAWIQREQIRRRK